MRIRAGASAAWVAAVAAALLASALGCADDEGGPAAQADSGGSSAEAGSGGSSGTNGSAAQGGHSGASGSSGSAGTGGADCAALPPPGYVPEGWVPFTEYSCSQPFYMPPSPEHLPKPLKWKPCPDVAQLPKGCEVQDIDWPHNDATKSYRTPTCQRRVRQLRLETYVPMGGEWIPDRAETSPYS